MKVPARLSPVTAPPRAQILVGHLPEALAALAPKTVHTAVCSPPFYAARDYETDPVVWSPVDGTTPCEGEHRWGADLTHSRRGFNPGQNATVGNTLSRVCPPVVSHGSFCTECAAWKGQLGLEPDSDLYVRHLVQCFESVRRVLRDDGTLWVNLDDSYHSGEFVRHDGVTPAANHNLGLTSKKMEGRERNRVVRLDERDEQLLLVPHRFANAMQRSGWILRADLVWEKPNAKPDSPRGWHWTPHRVIDRTLKRYVPCAGCAECTNTGGLVLRTWRGRPVRTHEYLFLFSKGPAGRAYFYDEGGVREPGVTTVDRALRSVWRIPTHSLKFAHTAAFPERLPALAIAAGTPPRVCAKCHAPWARVYARPEADGSLRQRKQAYAVRRNGSEQASTGWAPALVPTRSFRPTCSCGPVGAVAATVLDPFSGSGRTGVAALKAGRRYVGVDLNPVYAEVQRRHLKEQTGVGV